MRRTTPGLAASGGGLAAAGGRPPAVEPPSGGTLPAGYGSMDFGKRAAAAAKGERSGRKAGQGSKWLRPATRIALYARDGFACAYCGEAAEDGATLTIDHLLACDLGGDNSPSNLVTACLRCNSRKRALTMRAWFALLRDEGVDTNEIGSRIRRMVRRPLDRTEARRILAARG